MEGGTEASWPYESIDSQRYPDLGLRVRGPKDDPPLEGETLVRLDTGYDGFLLIPSSLYEDHGFHLSELPRDQWGIGESVTGDLFLLRRASAIVEIPRADLQLEGYVETFRHNQETLAGLELLSGVRVLLDGPGQHLILR